MSEITEEEFADWRTFARIEPIGILALEMLFARQTIALLTRQAGTEGVFPFSHKDIEEAAERAEEERIAAGEPTLDEIRMRALAQAMIDAEKIKEQYGVK